MTTTVDGGLGVTTPLLTLVGGGRNTLQPALAGIWTQTLPSANGTLVVSPVAFNPPAGLGSSGDVLTTDGAGNLSWASGGGGGILPIAQGGTNASTAAAALNNLLPTQTSANKDAYLTTDGAGNVAWSIPRNITRNNYIAYQVSGTYTPNSSVLAFSVVIVGSTGGIVSGTSITNPTGGQGGGGYTEKTYTSGFAGTYTVTIGAGGTNAGTIGGTTSFQLSGVGPSVVGSAGVTSTTGSVGGYGVGGDVNFTGGTGGNAFPGTQVVGGGSGGGGGGAASRTGNGGNGGDGNSSQGGGGGTGGNAASGITPGVAGTSLAVGVTPYIYPVEGPWLAGSAGAATGTNPSTNSTGGVGAPPYTLTLSTLYTTAYPGARGTLSTAIGRGIGGLSPGNTTGNPGQQGMVYVIEYY